MSQPRVYLAVGGKHVSSNGFVNYLGGRLHGDDLKALHDRIAKECGRPGVPVVIIDGSDNWNDSAHRQGAYLRRLARDNGIPILAEYHSGVSGINNSGMVIERKDLLKLATLYHQEYERKLDEVMKVYQP